MSAWPSSKGFNNSGFDLWLMLGLIFIMMGSLPALVGAGIAVYSMSQGIGTTSTAGTVTALVKARSHFSGTSSLRPRGTPGPSYYPVVRFKVNNQTYAVSGLAATTQTPYQVGQKVRVLYRTNQPSEAFIDSFTERWLGAFLCTGIGALLIIPGILCVRQHKRQKNQQSAKRTTI